jgi:hypothetical protein
VFYLVHPNRFALVVEDHTAGAGCALINGGDVMGHNQYLSIPQMLRAIHIQQGIEADEKEVIHARREMEVNRLSSYLLTGEYYHQQASDQFSCWMAHRILLVR